MTFARTIASLPEHLPWAALIAPSVVCTTSGALHTTFAIRGPDVDSLTESALIARAAQLNHVFQRYGYGWALQWETQRRPATAYPPSTWPNAVSRLVDAERAALFADAGAHFESDTYLTLVMQTPREQGQHLWRWLYERRDDAPQTNYHELVSGFQEEVRVLEALLRSLFVEVRRLSDDETLTYLHSCCSTKRHPVVTPRCPVFLSHVLADEPLTGGEQPLLGAHHLRIVSIKSWPHGVWPGLLAALDDLPLAYRLSLRWLPLDKSQALRETRRAQRRWLQKRKGLLTMLREEVMKRDSAMIQPEADQWAADAVEAQAAIAGGDTGLGYLTLHLIVWDTDLARVQDKTELVERTLMGEGFTTRTETQHSVEAWLATMPGNLYEHLRAPLLSSHNLVDLAPTTAIWSGPTSTPHLHGPPLCYATTGSSTPFRVSLHADDVGHAVMVGPIGSGKSTLLAFLALQWQRYPGARVVILDTGQSARCATAAMQGAWYALGDAQHGLSLQPLVGVDDLQERAWAAEWLEDVLTEAYRPLTPAERQEIWRALTSLGTVPTVQRTLTTLSVVLQAPALCEALHPFTLAGAHGDLLDGETDTLPAQPWQCFETLSLMQTPRLIGPVMTCLFHKLQAQHTGVPIRYFFDEGWVHLHHPLMLAWVQRLLVTLRKYNGSVVFATQSLAQLARSPIAPILNESCPTRLFLANPHALEEEIAPFYAAWGLNERQRTLIAHAIPKQHYYLQTPQGARVLDFQLGPVALAFCGASRPEDIAAIAHMSAASPATFAADWLRYRGLAWAAEALTNDTHAEEKTVCVPDRMSSLASVG
jgi:type IV secretion system protein TrbE